MMHDSTEKEQLWMGAYLAAYAIVLFKGPMTEKPKNIDPLATAHADWVVARIEQRDKEFRERTKQLREQETKR